MIKLSIFKLFLKLIKKKIYLTNQKNTRKIYTAMKHVWKMTFMEKTRRQLEK